MTKQGSGQSAWIVIDHGSRQAEANAVVVELAREIQRRRPGILVTHAHMEIAEPSLEQAIASCAEQGAQEILVLPHFLAPGRHTRETIPEQVAALARSHPRLTFEIAEPLGTHPRLVDILCERAEARSR